MSDSAIITFALIAATTGIAYGLYLAMWVFKLNPGYKETFVESRHDTAAWTHFDEHNTDDGREDGYAAQRKRIENGRRSSLEQREGQHHGRYRRDRVGLEEICGHTGTITDIVPHVISDYGRIAWVVFRNPGFDLADEVGSDVRGLCIDPPTDPGKHRDQTAAESQAEQGMDRLFLPGDRLSDRIKTGNRQQPEAN